MANSNEKAIVVTGGCGYLGYSVLRELPSHGWKNIVIIDNLSKGLPIALVDLPGSAQFRFVHTDILDQALLAQYLREASTVIHLASLSSNPISIGDSAQFEQVNHWGTAALMQACREHGIERIIYASDTCVYGEGDVEDETATCNPIGQYAQSMFNGEAAARRAIEDPISLRILRLGMLHGYSPAMNFKTFINRMAFSGAIGKSLAVNGAGNQSRPTVHINDATTAVCTAASVGSDWPDLTNIVTDNPTVESVAQLIRAETGSKIHYTEQNMLARISLTVRSSVLVAKQLESSVDLKTSIQQILKRFGGLSAPVHAI